MYLSEGRVKEIIHDNDVVEHVDSTAWPRLWFIACLVVVCIGFYVFYRFYSASLGPEGQFYWVIFWNKIAHWQMFGFTMLVACCFVYMYKSYFFSIVFTKSKVIEYNHITKSSRRYLLNNEIRLKRAQPGIVTYSVVFARGENGKKWFFLAETFSDRFNSIIENCGG